MSVSENLEAVRNRIAEAARRAGRDPDGITLVAVTKTFPASVVEEAVAAGHTVFGENYIQDALSKTTQIPDATWHFIGHLQTNKAKTAVEHFDVVQTVDSERLAKELNKRAKNANKTLDVFVQVNVGGEEQKSGVEPDEVEPLLRRIAEMGNLRVKGLMTMPPFLEPEEVRPYFKRLRELRDALTGTGVDGVDLSELSMGMSGDFEVAIEEGATVVRVGTAIFGARG